MGIEKQGSKGGNYVGGFLQLFDWNAKSRKKLFSSKSDLPEKSKQKKRFDGNLPMTRLQMLDEDDFAAKSSVKESSEYSCASSVTDEDFYGARAPGVVARLMGLDSLPKSNTIEPYSTPLSDCQSLPGAYYQTKNLEYHKDPQVMQSGSLQEVPVRSDAEPKYQKVVHSPIEKFQADILPRKSAKAVPITRHKLLSPIKNANSIPPKDAAHIMEAAVRIIEPRPQASANTKAPLAGSSSVPLKVRDIKEKIQVAQKSSKHSEGTRRLGELSAVKNLKVHSLNKSGKGPEEVTLAKSSPDSEECSIDVKNKGKSVSLALLAKANVQERVGLSLNRSRTLACQKETSEISPNQLFKSQSVALKNTVKKPSKQNCSGVLRQNNQKQNCTVDRGKLSCKSNLQGGKVLSGDSSFARQRNSSKLVDTSKVSSQKLGLDVKDDKRQALSSSSERVTRKKRSVDGNYHSEKNQAAHSSQKDKNGRVVQSGNIRDMQSSWDQENGRTGTGVISFTFTSPMTRSGVELGRSSEGRENCKIFPADSRSKRILLSSDGINAPKSSVQGNNGKEGDILSTLLEQKLKELNLKVEFSQQKSGTSLHSMVPDLMALTSSTMQEENKNKDGSYADNLEGQPESSVYSLKLPKGFITGQKCQDTAEEFGIGGRHISEDRKIHDCRLPSPVSILEHSSFVGSCNSSDTVDSNSTGGGNQCASIQYQDILGKYPLNAFLPFEGDAELSDPASSTSSGTEAKRRGATLTLPHCGKLTGWELEYVKAMLCNIELMFKDYASGRVHDIINPHTFDQLESQKGYMNGSGLVPRLNRRVLFDCVSECLELRCRQYAVGGFKLWAKGQWVVKGKDKLSEDVYKQISGWSGMGDFMVDELVDSDMSSQHGRWLDFEIEAFELGVQIESRILNSLIDEVVADILVL